MTPPEPIDVVSPSSPDIISQVEIPLSLLLSPGKVRDFDSGVPELYGRQFPLTEDSWCIGIPGPPLIPELDAVSFEIPQATLFNSVSALRSLSYSFESDYNHNYDYDDESDYEFELDVITSELKAAIQQAGEYAPATVGG